MSAKLSTGGKLGFLMVGASNIILSSRDNSEEALNPNVVIGLLGALNPGYFNKACEFVRILHSCNSLSAVLHRTPCLYED